MARYQGTTAQRGYGGQHQRVRAQWKPAVDAGQAYCAEVTCLEPSRWIQPGTPWHLAHDDGQRGYRGPAHERCNIAEVNRRRGGTRRRKVPRPQPARWRTSRRW